MLLGNCRIQWKYWKCNHITDETQIEHIIENLKEIKLKRSKPSVGYSGYSFKMTIYLSDGNEADDWNNFMHQFR